MRAVIFSLQLSKIPRRCSARRDALINVIARFLRLRIREWRETRSSIAWDRAIVLLLFARADQNAEVAR
jgi:hypothetical protein